MTPSYLELQSLLKTWKTSRKMYEQFFDDFSLDQLNIVPDGFSNNLIWNIGHIIVAQQGLVYLGSGQLGYVTKELFDQYKPGTTPTEQTTAAEVLELKHLLNSLVEKTEIDLQNGVFSTYKERQTGTGFHLSSLVDALEFNNYHEGIHLGLMMNIRKFV